MWRIYDGWKKLVGKVFKMDNEFDYRPLASSESSTISSSSEELKANPLFDGGSECNSVSMFTLSELAKATNNFKTNCFLGESHFGGVYRGRLKRTNQVVAIINQFYGKVDEKHNRVFLAQVSRSSLLHHPNIITLIGYCVDKDQRLLVYEYMPLGSLKENLHDLGPDKKPLDWNTRMEIAAAVAKALEYLHDKANPPVLSHVLNSSTILLDEDYHPKLSGFGYPSTKLYAGCVAPENAMTGVFTPKCDVYSFGVVLLQIITGRKALDNVRAKDECVRIPWAKLQFRHMEKVRKMADPMLQGQYPCNVRDWFKLLPSLQRVYNKNRTRGLQ